MRDLTYIFVLCCMTFAAGCNSDKKSSAAAQKDTTKAPAKNRVVTTQNVHLFGIDKLHFAVKKQNDALNISDSLRIDGVTYYLLEGFKTQSGQKLTVKLTTVSDKPAASMSHSWLLLKKNVDASMVLGSSQQTKKNDYVARKNLNLVIDETGLVPPGTTVAITFTTPQKPGKYQYICTFPGHFSAGMKGTLYVK